MELQMTVVLRMELQMTVVVRMELQMAMTVRMKRTRGAMERVIANIGRQEFRYVRMVTVAQELAHQRYVCALFYVSACFLCQLLTTRPK